MSDSDRKVFLAQQVEMLTSRPVLERAAELLGHGQSFDELKSAVSVHPSSDAATISIAATTPDRGSAATVANAVGTAYQQVMGERAATDAQLAIAGFEKLRQQYQSDLDAIPAAPDGSLTSRQRQLYGQIADLEQREQDVTARLQVYASGVQYFGRAEPPTSPSQPQPKRAAMLGGLVGLIVAGALAWWAAARDQRSEGRGEPARILEAPLLGEVPRLQTPKSATAEPATLPDLHPAVADAFHVIVATVEHELAGLSGKSIAVTSARMGATKTSTAMQIAHAASQQNRKVLLIDADERMRYLSKYVGAAEVAPERDVHRPAPWREATGSKEYIDRLVLTDSGMVLPVPSDPNDPWNPAGSYRATDVNLAVRTIGDMFDFVLIDTPPLLASSTALGVAGQADGVVLIVSHRIALRHLREVRDRLAFVKSPLMGYVYVRPRRRGVGALWERVVRSLRRMRAGRG